MPVLTSLRVSDEGGSPGFRTLGSECAVLGTQVKYDLLFLSLLQRLCSPVYCRYQFHKTPVHETKREPHGTHVFFRDINVVFLGAMNPSDVREYLEGPPMVVEVHDRDRKLEEYSRKPALFGEDLMDSYFNLQAFVSHRDTEKTGAQEDK